jgi:hypothetical protein
LVARSISATFWIYACFGAAGADADSPNGGVLNIEDDAIELQGQCDLKDDANGGRAPTIASRQGREGRLDAFFVYGRVVMAWLVQASSAGR